MSQTGLSIYRSFRNCVSTGIAPEPVPPAEPATSKKASVSKNPLVVLMASTILSASSLAISAPSSLILPTPCPPVLRPPMRILWRWSLLITDNPLKSAASVLTANRPVMIFMPRRAWALSLSRANSSAILPPHCPRPTTTNFISHLNYYILYS